jgi:hypothetical protein
VEDMGDGPLELGTPRSHLYNEPIVCAEARESRCRWGSVKSLEEDMPLSSLGVPEWSLGRAAALASSKCAFGRGVGAVVPRKEVDGG